MENRKGWHSRGYLPHYDVSNVYQFITVRLYDSVPDDVLEIWRLERTAKGSNNDGSLAEDCLEKYDVSSHGFCAFNNDEIAEMSQQALLYHHNKKYKLLEWCIMPNHIHVLIMTNDLFPLSEIIHSWKSFIASRANRILGRSGKFWMSDYFDRYIRNDQHFHSTIDYIRNNPVKAKLVGDAGEWPWSSAGRK